MLNPLIIKKIHNKSKLEETTIRSAISRMKDKYPSLTDNGVAYLYGLQLKKGSVNVRTLLNEEDKKTLPSIEMKPIEKIKIHKNSLKKEIKKVIVLQTDDLFINGHIEEINKAYNYGCYTSVVILARKITENFIIDILNSYFPPTTKENKELYFDISMGRSKDFSIILDNFYKKRVDFGTKKPIVEKLYKLAKELKGEANDKTHSWFHLVNRQKEVDDLEIQKIIELIKKLI